MLGDGFIFRVDIRSAARALLLQNGYFHVLDFDANEQKVDLAHDHVLQMVLRLVVFELDVQAIFDAHFHLDAIVDLGKLS